MVATAMRSFVTYFTTRVRTKMRKKTLSIECTMIPIHALWNRREG